MRKPHAVFNLERFPLFHMQFPAFLFQRHLFPIFLLNRAKKELPSKKGILRDGMKKWLHGSKTVAAA